MIISDETKNEADETCDPTIEVCSKFIEKVIEGELQPTLWLGSIAIMKAFLPAILRQSFFDQKLSTSTVYKYAWAVW